MLIYAIKGRDTMYKPKFVWPQNDIPDFLNRLYQNSYNYTSQHHPTELNKVYGFIEDVEEYLFQCFQTNIISDDNYSYIIEKLSTIKFITVLPMAERGIYGKYEDNCIFVNPSLAGSQYLNSRGRQRLYTFHELGHALIDESHKSMTAEEHYGWALMNEGITQEVAEKLTYRSCNLKRPTKEFKTLGNVFDIDTPDQYQFYTNFDYYGYIQPIIQSISNTLFWNFNPPMSHNEKNTIYYLCRLAFRPGFTDKMYHQAAQTNLGEARFSDILKHMGVLLDSNYKALGFSRLNTYYEDANGFAISNRARMNSIFTTLNN